MALLETKAEEQEMMAKSESPVFDTPEDMDERLAKPVKVPENLSDITDRALLKQHLLEAFDTACDECGGPTQWLLRRFPTQEDSESFRVAWEDGVPDIDDYVYQIVFFDGATEWELLAECTDPKIERLLMWLYACEVLDMRGNQVVAFGQVGMRVGFVFGGEEKL
eukprot:s1909_g3.t1